MWGGGGVRVRVHVPYIVHVCMLTAGRTLGRTEVGRMALRGAHLDHLESSGALKLRMASDMNTPKPSVMRMGCQLKRREVSLPTGAKARPPRHADTQITTTPRSNSMQHRASQTR